MSFLDLPYDIRAEIYSHLFPRTRHIYLHATSTGPVHLPSRDSEITTGFLQTCKALHQEASEYLYNGYQFDVVGRKTDCVEQYGQIHATIKRYARDKVHCRAFSNGLDSSTGCISIVTGEAKLAILEGRRRGQPTSIEELGREESRKQSFARQAHQRFWRLHQHWISSWALATAVGAISLLLARLALVLLSEQ